MKPAPKYEQPGNKTEFDMSVATLQRIDRLIKVNHELYLDSMPTYDTNELYLRTLDRIYIEASIKMTENEKDVALKFQTDINNLRIKWGNNLYMPSLDRLGSGNRANKDYARGWYEIKVQARDYELFLMKTMERHGMLLKDQTRIEDSIL